MCVCVCVCVCVCEHDCSSALGKDPAPTRGFGRTLGLEAAGPVVGSGNGGLARTFCGGFPNEEGRGLPGRPPLAGCKREMGDLCRAHTVRVKMTTTMMI